MSKEKLMDRARDELFSHINRCGVLKAAEEDQKHWMDETIEYLGERYPDLADTDLGQLYEIGIRFCKPAIARGAGSNATTLAEAGPETPVLAETASEANDMADAGVA